MNRYSYKAISPRYVHVKMTLLPGEFLFTPITMHFLYDIETNCLRYGRDAKEDDEIVLSKFDEIIDVDGMFQCEEIPDEICDCTWYSFRVKSGKRIRNLSFATGEFRLGKYKSYEWLHKLFNKYCDENHLFEPMPVPIPPQKEYIEEKKEQIEYLTGVELIEAATPKNNEDEEIEIVVSFYGEDGSPIDKAEDAHHFSVAMYSKKTGERLNEAHGCRLSKQNGTGVK